MNSRDLYKARAFAEQQSKGKRAIAAIAGFIPAVLFAGFLLFPVTRLALSGNALTGMHEEIVRAIHFNNGHL